MKNFSRYTPEDRQTHFVIIVNENRSSLSPEEFPMNLFKNYNSSLPNPIGKNRLSFRDEYPNHCIASIINLPSAPQVLFELQCRVLYCPKLYKNLSKFLHICKSFNYHHKFFIIIEITCILLTYFVGTDLNFSDRILTRILTE